MTDTKKNIPIMIVWATFGSCRCLVEASYL